MKTYLISMSDSMMADLKRISKETRFSIKDLMIASIKESIVSYGKTKPDARSSKHKTKV